MSTDEARMASVVDGIIAGRLHHLASVEAAPGTPLDGRVIIGVLCTRPYYGHRVAAILRGIADGLDAARDAAP